MSVKCGFIRRPGNTGNVLSERGLIRPHIRRKYLVLRPSFLPWRSCPNSKWQSYVHVHVHVFYDLHRAFDSVQYPVLFKCLYKAGINVA